MDNVYVVTYWTDELDYEPVVTVFNNKDAAEKCCQYFRKMSMKTCVDECQIYSSFYIKEGDTNGK